MDEHLASLRKTISNIDSTIPFLGLGGSDDEEEEIAEEVILEDEATQAAGVEDHAPRSDAP